MDWNLIASAEPNMFLTDSTCPYGAGVEFEFIIENGQVQSFTFNGGTYYGGNPVPDQAEHKKSDPAVKAAMAGAKPIRINQLAGAVPQSYSAEFALTFSQGPKTLTVGRFHQKGKQVYLLVNRLQKDISVEVKGQKSVQMLDPSTGKIKKVSLPATLPIKAVRALMLIP